MLVAIAACGQVDAQPDASTVDSAPRQTVTDSQTLQPGMLVEGSWLAGTSDQIGITLSTTLAGMDWDIHAHADGGTQEVVAVFAQMESTYDFRPNQQAQWYLLIRNSSATVLTINVAMDLYGQAQWQGWDPP